LGERNAADIRRGQIARDARPVDGGGARPAIRAPRFLPRSAETRTGEFLALNANARVATIDDDRFILSESMAVNRYLAKKHTKALPEACSKALSVKSGTDHLFLRQPQKVVCPRFRR
jgi:hypothetical protein